MEGTEAKIVLFEVRLYINIAVDCDFDGEQWFGKNFGSRGKLIAFFESKKIWKNY